MPAPRSRRPPRTTHRRAAESRAIERLLDELVEGTWEWDISRRSVRHNTTWCRMLGVGPEFREHPLAAHWRFIHPDDAEGVRAAFAAALRGEGRLRHEYRMVRADGTLLWVVDRGAVTERGPDGRALRMVGSLLDVTAERERLDEQQQAAQRLRLALKAGDFGLWDWDYASGGLVVDERWKLMLGIGADETVTTIDVWAARVHPDDLAKLEAVVRDVIEPPQGTDFAVEVRARHADGRWVWILDQGLVAQRDAAGRPLRVIGTHKDVTRRKASARRAEQERQQLQTIVDTAMDAIVTVDASLKVVVFNRAAERMFGVPAADVLGGSFDRFMPPSMRGGEHDRRMVDFIGSQRRTRVISSLGGGSMAVRADGTEFPVEASVSRSGQGDDTLLTAVIRDVTEVQRAREAMLEKERAEQASAAKSAFLSRVSHELRTPLNAILGFADLMRDAEPAVARRQLEHLRQAGRRLLNLVNDLLDLGRIEAGRHALDLQPLALGRALSQVAELVSAEILQRGLRLVVELDEEHCAVRADARALDQVLLNLLSNAVKFSPVGGTVRVRVDAHDAAMVRISVCDEGPGIPPEQFGELFKPYSRLDGGVAAKVPGTGLGLAISQGLARQMGGDLAPEVVPNGGTCMTLSVPRASPPEHEEAPAAPASASTQSGALDLADEALKGGRALVVEDDPASAVLLEHLFVIAGGWTVQIASTVPAALACLAAGRFDLVLTDMNIEGEDGLQVVAAANRHPERATMRVVAVTADAMPAQLQRIRAAGADGCWPKPVEVDRVMRFLRARRSRWLDLLSAG
jgi:PAS domain S-box-containing protein